MWRNTRLFILFATRRPPSCQFASWTGRSGVILLTLLAATTGGCSTPLNVHPPRDESAALSDVVQLTSGFTRAGEAYFSPDQRWIVFQASTQADPNYAMYLARLRRSG